MMCTIKSATAPCKKNINDLHVELGNSSESITHATALALGIQVTSTFKLCEDCTLQKAKQQGVSKTAVAWSTILGERLFFDISSPSTPTFGSKKHWLLIIDDSSNFLEFHSKENSNLVDIILGLIEKLKNKYNLQCCLQESLQTGRAGCWLWIYRPRYVTNRMAVLKENLLPSSTRYMPCSTMVNLSLKAKATNTAMLLKNYLFYLNRTLSPFQQFLGRQREASCLYTKNWWNVYHHLQG